MNHYQLFKWLHIISASGLLSSGIAGLIIIICLNKNHKLRTQLLPKTLILSSALVFLFSLSQVLTGFAIMSIKQESSQPWAILTWTLFSIVAILYLVALFLQLQCHQIYKNTDNNNYLRYYRLSIFMALPIGFLLAIMYFLMSNTPKWPFI